jgi:hypothetical protein
MLSFLIVLMLISYYFKDTQKTQKGEAQKPRLPTME